MLLQNARGGGPYILQTDIVTLTTDPRIPENRRVLYAMCAAVSAIDAGAWDGHPTSPGERVTPEVTLQVTLEPLRNEKPPTFLENVGGKMEREKGFEPSTLALARRCSTTELFPQELSRRGVL